MIRKEADEETEYVQKFCKDIGVKCYVKRVDVISKSNSEKIGKNVQSLFFFSLRHLSTESATLVSISDLTASFPTLLPILLP